MSITDELRMGGIYRFPSNRRVFTEEELTAIADRIDAEHRAMLVDARMKVYQGYIELPKDADGEVIHVGDELHDGWHEQNQGEVEWLMLDHHGWWLMFKNNCERFYLHEFHEWHHHHAPTVEDVLREFGKAWVEWEDGSPCDPIAQYAPKLRLAGDGE